MNRKKYIVIYAIGFFYFFYSSVSAQRNFRPGYVITLSSDTIYGQIDARGAIKNSESCPFQKKNQEAIITYHPGEIKAYRFTDGKFYISKAVPDSSGEKLIFLEYLLHGLTDLYYYKTFEKERYYIQKSGGPFIELSNDVIIHNMTLNRITNRREASTEADESVGNVDGQYMRNSLKYLGVLNSTFADCNKLKDKINLTQFNPRSLIKITREYHEFMCDSFQCVIYEKRIAAKVKFAPAIRSDFSNISFNTSEGINDKNMLALLFYTNLHHPMKFNYGIGLNMDISSTRSNEKFSIQIETFLSKNYFKDEGTEIQTLRHYYHTVTMSNIASENFVSLKYTYPNGTVRPTAFFGGNGFVGFNAQNKRVTVETIGNTSNTNTYYDVPINNRFFGISGGAGIDIVLASKKTAFIQIKLEKYWGEIIGMKPNSYLNSISIHSGIYLF